MARREGQTIQDYLRELRKERDNTFRFQWERAIRNDRDLKSTTRLVLFVLGTHMDNDGTNLRPSADTIAAGAAISRRAALQHVSVAASSGWLEVLERGRKVGSGSNAWGKASEYVTHIPLDVSHGDSPSCSDENDTDAQRSEGDPHAPHGDPRASEGDGGSHHRLYTGSKPAAAAADLNHEPTQRDIEIRRHIRAYQDRTGEVAGPGMRKRIAEQVDADLAADAMLDHSGASLAPKIRAAELYGERFAMVLSRTAFMDDLAQKRDWATHPEVIEAAVRAYDMHTRKVC